MKRLFLIGLIVVCGTAWPALAAAKLVVDHIVVRGATGVTTRVLATRMHLYPGDPVDFAVLKAAEQRLLESDLFSSVRVFIDLPPAEAVRRMYLDDTVYPVEVAVEAVGKLTWFAFPTAGFGSGDWAGGLAYANQNFTGRDVHILGAGQIGLTRSFVHVPIQIARFRARLLQGGTDQAAPEDQHEHRQEQDRHGSGRKAEHAAHRGQDGRGRPLQHRG